MSISLKKASFIVKKKVYDNINFEIKNTQSTTILYNDMIDIKKFKKILSGYYPLQDGTFIIDGYDMVDRAWTKKRVAEITAGNKLFKKWPEKLWLFGFLYFNQAFYAEAKESYIEKKYSYLNFVSSKNNISDLEMRHNVEEIVDRFIKTSIDIETKWLDEFFTQIKDFNDKEIDKSIDNFDSKIKVIIKDYYSLLERTANLRLLETFLESLWDKVYSFLDLNSSCPCQYNAKRGKQRALRKKSKEFAFTQQNYVIRKRLKIIDIKVREIKRKQSANRLILSSLHRRIIQSVQKSHNRKIKHIDGLFDWRQLSKDQRFEFKQKQEKMYYESLSDEANLIRGKIVERMHKYHNLVLYEEIIFGNNDEFREQIAKKKMEIKSVYRQASDWIQNSIDELQISFSFIKSILKFSLLNTVYFRLLTNIFLKRDNLIFTDVLSKLTRDEAHELINATKILSESNNKNTCIFIEQKLQNVADLSKNISILHNKKIIEKSFTEILKEYWDEYGQQFLGKRNQIEYKFDGKYIVIFDQRLKINNNNLNTNGILILNPQKLFLSKKDFKGDYISVEIEEINEKKFLDDNLKCFSTKDNNKFLVLTNEVPEKKPKLYITEESILKIQ